MKYQPQLAKLPSKKFDPATVSGPGWVRERKWDGMRAIVEVEPGQTRIFSRTGQDLCPQFPELCELHKVLPARAILDAEIVALREPDVEDLELLQLRLGDKLARRRADVPVEIRFFDILELLGEDVRCYPLTERQTLLDQFLPVSFVRPEILPPGAETPAHWEGTIAKRAESPYCSGKRNSDWLKFKFTQRATLRVTGYTPGKGARENSFGAILVADANGVPRGQVGSGFTDRAIADMLSWFTAVDSGQGPLVEVEYRFLSKTGLLVNTAFKGLRPDKDEADVL